MGHITTQFISDLYAYEDRYATADDIFAELDEKWDMVERAKAYAQANEFPEPKVLGDYLAFARAYANELELYGWAYHNLINSDSSLALRAKYKEQEACAWQDASSIRKYVMDCLIAGAHLSTMDFGELGHSLEIDKDGEWVLKWGLMEAILPVPLC